MKRKLIPGDFALQILILKNGISDFKLIAPDKKGMAKAKTLSKTLMPFLFQIDDEVEKMGNLSVA